MKPNQQSNDTNQVGTLTEKSSQLEYLKANVEPRQGIAKPGPGEITPNDDGKK